MVIITVKPRQQIETWSLYWKESLNTKTSCLPEISLEIEENETLAQLMSLAARRLGWQPVEHLSRLPGFVSPFERVIQHGRELDLSSTIDKMDISSPLVFIRTLLEADGWSINLKNDPFASDSEEED